MKSPTTHQQIITAINAWDPGNDRLSWSSEHFEKQAHRVFTHQYTHNSAYRTYCNNRGITPADTPRSTQIPAVPTDAFKLVDLFTDGARAKRTFLTSGTTADGRGEHHFQTLDVYRASLHPPFVYFCNPNHETLRMLVLAPPPSDLPESSLSFMLGDLLDRWGDAESTYFVDLDDDGNWRLDVDSLLQALDAACEDDRPTMVLGTAFAFAEFFDRLDKNWKLPSGSRLMETGGFKGRTKTISRPELYDAFVNRLGIPRSHCLGEYSMTELSSQAYTDQYIAGGQATGRFYTPPWLDVTIVDPVKLTAIETPNTPGLIRFFDLANVDSVSAIQTSDRGILHADGGLELLGRAPDADLRGCSLTIEEIVSGT